MHSGIRTLANVGLILKICIALFGVTALVSGLTPLVAFSMDNAAPGPLMMTLMVASGVASLIQFFAFLVGGALLIVWVHQAYANLEKAQLPGLKRSAGWAAGSFFVPLINLVVPMRVMREIYNRSKGENEFDADADVALVTGWWVCALAAILVLTAIFAIFLIEVLPGLFVTMPMMGFAGLVFMEYLFALGSAFFLFRVVHKVTAAQRELRHVVHAEVFS